MHSVDLAQASPENFTFRTFQVYRSALKAARSMKRRKGKIRVMDLSRHTNDSRDVYFVVSFAGNYHDNRKPKEFRKRTRSKVTFPQNEVVAQ